jgi:hypothetical protein
VTFPGFRRLLPELGDLLPSRIARVAEPRACRVPNEDGPLYIS